MKDLELGELLAKLLASNVILRECDNMEKIMTILIEQREIINQILIILLKIKK